MKGWIYSVICSDDDAIKLEQSMVDVLLDAKQSHWACYHI